MKGAIYYVAIAKVIFSDVKITCYFHIWRYQVFARKLTWYFIGVYIITIKFFNVSTKSCSKMESILFQVLKTKYWVENLHLNVDIRNVIFIFNLARYSSAGVMNILYQEIKIERSVEVHSRLRKAFSVFFWVGGRKLFAKTEGDL